MTTQDLKNNREQIIRAITIRVGSENVKRVMERMSIFIDDTFEIDPIKYAQSTMDDMNMVASMEAKDSSLTKLACRATLGLTQNEYDNLTK